MDENKKKIDELEKKIEKLEKQFDFMMEYHTKVLTQIISELQYNGVGMNLGL